MIGASSSSIRLAPQSGGSTTSIRTTSSWNAPNAQQFPKERELPQQLRGWTHSRNAAIFVIRALIATSLRKDWKPRTEIPRRRIKRVLHQTERALVAESKQHLENAVKSWGAVPVKLRKKPFVGAIGSALYAARCCLTSVGSYFRGDYGTDVWTHLDQALARVELSNAMLGRIELRMRLDDLTDGRGGEVTDEDTRLACGAACDIGRYDVAREIARRVIEENE